MSLTSPDTAPKNRTSNHPSQEEEQQEQMEPEQMNEEASAGVVPWPVVNDSTTKPCSVSSKTSMGRSSKSRVTRVSTAIILPFESRDSGAPTNTIHKEILPCLRHRGIN